MKLLVICGFCLAGALALEAKASSTQWAPEMMPLSECKTGTGTTCETVFNGCIMHHGTSKAYCKMPVSAEFKKKYETACSHGGALYNEFAKPFANNHCTVIRRTIHGRGPDNINTKWKQLLDGVCKWHGDAAGVAGLSNLNGYFGTTQSLGRYTDEANCVAKGCGFAETSIASRESQCTSCTQGRYYKYWSTPAVLACQGGTIMQMAPKKLISLTTPAPTLPRTSCGSFSGADQTHCTGSALKQWPSSKGGSRAECTSFCEAAGAKCVVYQTRTQRCFCHNGPRRNGCRGCTARITFAAQCNVAQTPPPTPVLQPPFCVSGANCYNGPDRGLWFSSAEAWSLGAFPSFPEQVRTKKRIVLSERARGTSRNILIHDANVELAPGVNLEIGPTSCDASENLVQAATANTNSVCEPKVLCDYPATEYETSPHTPDKPRTCAKLTVCGSMQWEDIASTETSDRHCTDHTICDGDEYEAKAAGTHHDRICASHTKCAAAHWVTKEATPTSDRLCQAHRVCTKTQFETKSAGTHHDRECQAHRVCTNSEFETKDAGTHHDRQCQSHRLCKSGEWEVHDGSPSSDRVCDPLTVCQTNQYISVAHTATSDRTCSDIRTCLQDEFETKAPTSTSNRECQALTTCTADQWQTLAPGARNDRQCQELTKCMDTEYQTVAPSRIRDRQCKAHTSCTATEWEEEAAGTHNDRKCTAHTSCTATEWQTEAAGTHKDRKCKAHTSCTATEWEEEAAGTHNDRKCTAHRVCASTEFETKQAGTHHDRQCKAHTTCMATEWQTLPAGPYNDRKCKAHTSCTATEWEKTPAGAENDRVCRALTVCSATQWETVAATYTSNRACRDHTTCNDVEYETRQATGFQDRQCASHTSCATGLQWESKPSGTHHDRECTAIQKCTSTQWIKVDYTHTSDRVCVDHTVCKVAAPGAQFEIKAAGKRNDRECAICPVSFRCDGTATKVKCVGSGDKYRPYQDQAGQHTCKVCGACAEGQTRRQCGAGNPGSCALCAAGDVKVGPFACKSCVVGRYEDGARTSCQHCTAGRFAQAGSTGCTSCALGTYQPANEKGHCLPCGGWTHDEGAALDSHGTAGHTGCTAHTVCTKTEFETKAATLTSNRECSPHTICDPLKQYTSRRAGKHHDRECAPLTTCGHHQWESRWPGTYHDRKCTDRPGRACVETKHVPTFTPKHTVVGDPATFESGTFDPASPGRAFWNAVGGTYHSGAHRDRGHDAEDWPVTDVFDNIAFSSDKTGVPVRNFKCTDGDWCFYNGFDVKKDHCVNDGDWGWKFHRPVHRLSIATPDLPNFKSATVWIYNKDGEVLDRAIIGANNRGNGYLSFRVTCGRQRAIIARVKLEIHDATGTRFCLSRISFDGHAKARQCTHTTCKHEVHTCQHWRLHSPTGTVVQASAGDLVQSSIGRDCNNGLCEANGNCDGIAQHQSIRVYHKLLLRGKDNVLNRYERHCLTSHKCGMGVVTGNLSECECKEL